MLKNHLTSALCLCFWVASYATEVPTCGGGIADSNAEDGIEIANGVCAELFEDIGTADGILINDGATLTIYGDISSLSDKINIKPGGTLIIYGNIGSISNGILIDGGTLELYSNVTVDGGFEIKASSKLTLNGAYLTVSSGSGILADNSAELEMYNASTIEIVDGASKIDNGSNGTITSDGTGNTIETQTWDGDQGDFSCSSGSCSDFATTAEVIITESDGRTVIFESGTSDSFTVELSGGLTVGTVQVDFVSSNTSEGTVSPSSVSFSLGDMGAKTVTVTPVDDGIDDGPQYFTIIATTSTIGLSVPDYDGVPTPDVGVINQNDGQFPRVDLTETTLTISENGSAQTFDVVIGSQPASGKVVQLDVSSDDISEGTVSPSSLTFDEFNWDTPQTVTVTPVDDPQVDGDIDFDVTISVNTGVGNADGDYNSIADEIVAVTNQDDEVPGFSIDNTLTTNTSEIGTSTTFDIVLGAQPETNVVIQVTSQDLTEGIRDKPSLTFTNLNWSSPQTVTITGVDDALVDGDITYNVRLRINAGLSNDFFDPLPDQFVNITNQDDDGPGYTLSKTTSSITEGGNDTFTIVLDAEPSSNVVIDLSSDDTGAATVSPSSLTFTNGNWNSTQTVTITAEQDDDLQDESPTITASVNASSDGDFTGLGDQTVTTTITDDDAAGYTLSKTTSSITEGGNDTFTIVLDAEPSSNVVIDLSSDDTGAATVSPSSLTFTNGNWNSTQTVTITAEQDDDLQDESPTITASVNASSDGDFTGLGDQTVTTTITDDDAAGYTLSKTTSSITEGGNDTFTIVLDAEPSSNVVIDLSSDDTGAATVSPSSLTFTNGNWNSTQTVTITAEQDDDLQDESLTITASVNASSDGDFTGLGDQTVTTTITDDDAAGYTLSKTTSSITEGGNDTFTIVLDAEPSSNVVIDLSSDDTGAATVSPSSLTFTNGNWNSTQTVTITAEQDDDLQDESPTITASVNASSDGDFTGLGDQTVTTTITDDDAAGYTLSKTTSSITEGGNDTFTIVLDAEPSSNVVIDLSSDDTGAATVSPSSLTFTNGNWNSTQTVTITAEQDDDLQDESPTITASVNASSDGDFTGLGDQTVTTTITDDDAAGYTLSKTTSSITEGGNDTFTIVLDAEPSSNVVIDLSSDDTGAATVSPSSLTFTNGNWNSTQTVTITAEQDDDLQDESPTITATINDASSDDAFDPLGDQTVAVTITDDETADFSVSAISGNTSEGGASASFTIVLDAQPASNVVFTISSDNVLEGVVDDPSITFTTANWDTPQSINVSGVDDEIDDGDQSYTISVAVDDASSDDTFDALPDETIAVINEDDDVSGISVSTISGNTREDGTVATFTIELDSEPTGDVTIGLSSTDTSEGTVTPSNLTFTSANWSVAQTVTVTGVDDSDDDGDVTYEIVLAPAASSDANYSGADPSDITVINEDDENTPPVIAGQTGTISSDEDEAFNISLTDLNVTDPDHNYPDDHLLIIGSGTYYQVSGADIIPAENFNGSMIINVTVSDGIDESDNFELTVSILPVNDTPSLIPDQATVQFGNSINGNLLDNDSDIENDELTLTDISPELDGLSFNPDGSFTYDGTHAVGVFTLDYVVCDNGDPSECAQSTLTITVEDGDQDLDGIPDSYEYQFDDVDQDGIPEYLDVDSDNDNILDRDEAGDDPNNPVDSDGDGTPDFLDLDSDNDGKPDIEEGIEDCDGDGILNYIDSEDVCNMKIADAFSPNGDGKNDEWIIEGIENYPNNKVSIFNRWGVKVFEIDGYDNSGKVWRGQINANLGTIDAPFSTYYFIIDLKDGSKPIAGNILISR